ncbi:MAG TPA: hypothetical protein DCG77_00480 [Sphingobacterium sp.]|nr:hypothetical protein [Sphingobacterium sp.]
MNNEIQQRAKELLEQGAERRKKRFEKINRQEEKILRDQFAMQAMNGILMHYGFRENNELLAKNAYLIADAMLKARKEVYGE